MLVELHVSAWQGRRTDRSATAELVAEKHCLKSAASVIKHLIDKTHLQPIQAVSASLRETHRRLTLPWDDGGRRLLPVDIYDRYKTEIEKLLAQREREVDEFVAGFETAVNAARFDLGKLFDRDDYPTPDAVRRSFKADYEITPIPERSHFLANVGDDEANRIKSDVERKIGKRLNEASQDIYTRLRDAIQVVADAIARSDDKGKRLHASLLDTLRGLSETLPLLDINDNREIRKMCSDLRKLLADVSVDELRPKSKAFKPETREAVSAKLNDMSAAMAGYVGDGE